VPDHDATVSYPADTFPVGLLTPGLALVEEHNTTVKVSPGGDRQHLAPHRLL
jgi:hypothetical protein